MEDPIEPTAPHIIPWISLTRQVWAVVVIGATCTAIIANASYRLSGYDSEIARMEHALLDLQDNAKNVNNRLDQLRDRANAADAFRSVDVEQVNRVEQNIRDLATNQQKLRDDAAVVRDVVNTDRERLGFIWDIIPIPHVTTGVRAGVKR